MDIGRYKVLGLLGRGGMGRVYKVLRPELNKIMALKLLRPNELLVQLLGWEEVERRFWLEARIMGEMEHEAIASAWDVGEHRGEPFMVQEYLCMNLGCLIGESYRMEAPTRPIPPDRSLRFLAQTLLGLGRLHEAGIVHRDLKPYNLLLTRLDGIKIIDFGLSKLRGEVSATPRNMMVGSPFYAAPEQEADPERAGVPADIYSAGVLLYRLVTGRLPEEAIDAAGHPLLGPEWAAFFRKALHPEPEGRFNDVWAMLRAVEGLQEAWEEKKGSACSLSEVEQERPSSLSGKALRSEPVKTGPVREVPFPGLSELYEPLRPPANDFQEVADGFLDQATRLVWNRDISAFPMAWDRCAEYLDRLNSDREDASAHNPWRLPTVEELSSLLKPKRILDDFCISPLWRIEGRKWLWSGDLRTNPQAWFVDVEQGAVLAQDRTCLFFVLAVRRADDRGQVTDDRD